MFWETGWFKYLKNLLIGVGAGFIIIGALFKILHWPGANEVLTLAMIGEAAIFIIQGILPPAKDYKWERAYPALVNPAADPKKKGSITQQLDKALENNKVDGALIDSLGGHLRSLGDNIGKLTTMTDSASATEEYAKNAKEAANALGDVKVAYSNAANIANSLSAATEGTQAFHEQVQLISQNLAKLNAVYELELQDTNNHLKAMNQFYGNLTAAVTNMNDSVADTEKYKEQMSALAKNLGALNNVYGNMLSAMSAGIPRG